MSAESRPGGWQSRAANEPLTILAKSTMLGSSWLGLIMGHENIGTIAKAGREFTRRKGFKEGDLVFVEHYVACGKCEWCHLGQYRHCENTDWRFNPDGIRYGYTSAERAPRLWGGFAQYVYLPWNDGRCSTATWDIIPQFSFRARVSRGSPRS
jgi:threonine dehydrogenase-like Zn-dependent dehydrogenase